MKPGNVVEYIDREKIVCAVVTEVKSLRLRLLTENNREIKMSMNRLCHKSEKVLTLAAGRDQLVERLKQISAQRRAIMAQVDIETLWEVLNTEQEWIDLATMTTFCFPDNPDADHQSGVLRAFFNDRLYFKFNPDAFFPNSEDRVQSILAKAAEQEKNQRLIDAGIDLLKRAIANIDMHPAPPDSLAQNEAIAVLKSYYLFEKDSSTFQLGKAMTTGAGIGDVNGLFDLLVRMGVWEKSENIDLYRLGIPVAFPDSVIRRSNDLSVRGKDMAIAGNVRRVDLTALPLLTIDGQSTLDFDDAISIERSETGYRLGIHIADVAHYVAKEDPIDQEARRRGSAIYMPDQKIPMIPPNLAEDLCSLKAGEVRPAISLMVNLTSTMQIVDYEVFASWIQVKKQWTYYDVNLVADEEEAVLVLCEIAKQFRRQRLDQGAIHISLPEVTVWVAGTGEPAVHKINRESPGRMLIAEIMIMGNWLMAKFLARHGVPAVFRAQPTPKERLYTGEEESLFKNWMQRKKLTRFVLGHRPEPHAGLGLDAYVTATSPIRKYFDLITQRQIRSVFGLETPYTAKEIDQMIQMLAQPMSHVGKVQFRRQRYWLLRYLENMIGGKEEAIVLGERRFTYSILLKEYMIESELPKSGSYGLKKEDLVQVTIQRVDARRDVFAVYLG